MLRKNAAVLIIAALVVGVGTYAWAQGSPERPTTTAQTADKQNRPRPEGRKGRRMAAAPLRRAVHGDLIVRQKDGDGFENVSFDRGEVSAASGSSITIKRPDGQSVTKAIDGETKFRGVDSASQIKTGKPALVVSKGAKAVLVGQPDPDKARQKGPKPDNAQDD